VAHPIINEAKRHKTGARRPPLGVGFLEPRERLEKGEVTKGLTGMNHWDLQKDGLRADGSQTGVDRACPINIKTRGRSPSIQSGETIKFESDRVFDK